jgi:ubiquinone/menaquinone biosynthesis C-methylase UbiE
MLPLDLENYLSEIARVLKPGGRCVITFFILNNESDKLVQSGNSSLDFKIKIEEGCLTTNEKFPEAAIAYHEDLVLKLFKKYDLTINTPIYYGNWCKRDNALTYQDIIIATKN